MFGNYKRNRDKKSNREKEMLLNPERARKKRRRRVGRRMAIAVAVIVFLMVAGFAFTQVARAIGRSSLQKGTGAVGRAPQLTDTQEVSDAEKEQLGWQDGWVKYDDKIYAYNEDILTFLIMGIDKNDTVRETAEGGGGGQADALFLLVLDPDTKQMRLVSINRNTMTAVDVYDENGSYTTTMTAQVCLQHSYGNGLEESGNYQVAAVSNLFYRLPIHGFAAINMSAIPTLNDAVGGVDVTVLEDLTQWDPTLVKGAQVHLMGESAYVYISRRDIKVYGSADSRLERQKQYINAYLGQAKNAAKSNLGVVTGLYGALSSMMVTDVTFNEVAYLAPVVRDYSFDRDHIYTMKGETRTGTSQTTGNTFEEFYPDRDAMYRMILEVFYEEVNGS